MQKITLYIYPAEWVAITGAIPLPGLYSFRDLLNEFTLNEILLMEWRGRITPQQHLTWQLRASNKTYALKLNLPLAVALWQKMREMALSPDLQMLSDQLDRTLINSGFSHKRLNYVNA